MGDVARLVESSANPSLSVDHHGVTLGWVGVYGPVIARFASLRSLAPDWCEHLGKERSPSLGAPRLSRGGGKLAVAFDQANGVHLWVGPGRERWFLPGAAQAAVCHDGSTLHVVGIDERGIVVGRQADDGSAVETIATREQAAEFTVTASSAGGVLVVYATRDREGIGVAHVHNGEVRDVQHRVGTRVENLRAIAISSRTIVTFGEDVAMAIELSPSGTLRERAHPIAAGARCATPLWIGDRFAFLVRADDDLVLVTEEGDRQLVRENAPRGDVAVAYYGGELVVARIARSERGLDELKLLRFNRSDGMTQEPTIPLIPTDLAARSFGLDARDLVARAASTRRDYRGGSAISCDVDRLTLATRRDEAIVEAKIVFDEEIEVHLNASRVGVVESVWSRLRDRVLPRFGELTRLEEAEREHWETLTQERLARVEVSPRTGTIRVHVSLDSLPTAAQLARWLSELDARAERAWADLAT